MRPARETYVRPVTRAREARAGWRDTLPMRLLLVFLIVAAGIGMYILIGHLHITGAGNSQG